MAGSAYAVRIDLGDLKDEGGKKGGDAFNAIDLMMTELYGFWATIDTEAEFKELYNLEADVDFYTTSTLDTMLLDYITSSSLTTTLGDYVTSSSLTTTLGDYVTSSSLTTTLGDYVTSSSLTTTLGDYVETSDLATATVQTAGELAPTKESGVAGYFELYEEDTTNELVWGWRGPSDLSVNISNRPPNAAGIVGQAFVISAVQEFQTLESGKTGTLVTYTYTTVVPTDDGYGVGWDGDKTEIPSKDDIYDKIESLSISASTPTVQASDPTIADTTGYYIATNDYHYFWNEYGIRTVDLTAGALDDSDTTDPVNADGGTDSTHDGATSITLDVDVTEQYISTVTFSSTELGLTDVAMSQTGTAPNYTYTASVDPDGSTSTIDLVVTSTDLAGNTDMDTYNVTYSGGGSCTTSIYDVSETADSTSDIKESAAKTLVGAIYTADADYAVCALVFDVLAKDGAAIESNTYHAEVWTIDAFGENGCASSDGCLASQVGSDSDGVVGVGTWDDEPISFAIEASLTNGTTYFIGVTHNNTASTATEASLRYDSANVIGARAQVDGDTTGAAITDTAGAPNFSILTE